MSNRERLIQLSKDHRLSHLGSCLTALPIIEEIYEKKRPGDKFVLSAGHAHLAHLVVREGRGEINAEEKLQYGIHCDRQAGCEASTGSLGTGLPIAVGMALADKESDVYVLVSDGELAEGSCWEALEVIRKYHLTNLKLYVNANGWSAYDEIDKASLKRRLEATGVGFFWRDTDSDIGTWSIGLQSHYKVADEELK